MHVAVFLNQACAWFLKIAFVQEVGMHVCMCMCPRPQAINNSGMT